PQFMHEWRRYQRALKQRNAGLKKGISHLQLQAWTDILIESGEYIDRVRRQYCQEISKDIPILAETLVGMQIDISYRSGWTKDLSFAQALENSAEREQKTGLTGVGPHRADLVIRVGGEVLTNNNEHDSDEKAQHTQFHRAQQRVSRGQQKLIAASMMLAQAVHFREKHQVSPILLIDDPFAELDSEHSKRLLQAIQDLDAQTFVTALSPIDHPIFAQAKQFHVEHGKICKA
ncbi:MAG: hypothetical protein KJO88_10950, partial [Gammaproteobacteria bacterium]|nr:hypothetical protein [Gammaproteobacteria bacterium]